MAGWLRHHFLIPRLNQTTERALSHVCIIFPPERERELLTEQSLFHLPRSFSTSSFPFPFSIHLPSDRVSERHVLVGSPTLHTPKLQNYASSLLAVSTVRLPERHSKPVLYSLFMKAVYANFMPSSPQSDYPKSARRQFPHFGKASLPCRPNKWGQWLRELKPNSTKRFEHAHLLERQRRALSE